MLTNEENSHQKHSKEKKSTTFVKRQHSHTHTHTHTKHFLHAVTFTKKRKENEKNIKKKSKKNNDGLEYGFTAYAPILVY